jgi:glutathione S-transferase
MKITLYAIPGSHPVRAVRLMLEYKGIPYRRVDLPPVVSRYVVPHVLRFPGNRVPAMKIDGRKVQGSRAIARELDELQPEPPLYPADPAQRSKVEEAERWGDTYLQELPRKISWWALKRRKGDQASFLREARLGLPTGVVVATSGPIIRRALRVNNATDDVVRETLAAIPGALDRVDQLISDGVLNGAQLNAADFQIGASLRLLGSFEDIAPALEGRPAGELARRVLPEAPGHIGQVYPAEWLEPLREPSRAPEQVAEGTA